MAGGAASAARATGGWAGATRAATWRRDGRRGQAALSTRCATRAGRAVRHAWRSSGRAGSASTVAGDTLLGLYEKERLGLSQYVDEYTEDRYWQALDADLRYWTRSLRPVQWYPGHIAKTEKELKEQLKLMDVVIEIRDARIPLSTSHPKMDSWLGNRRRIIVLNREDMISTEDRNAWATYFANQGTKVVFSNGQLGMGTMKLGRMAKSIASVVNTKRREKGLLPRPVRAGIVGYPNVGKSSLINRLLKRRMCPAAPRPGVTRELKWVRFGTDLELLDSPGILPMRISDQTAAIKLAICDDIGERSYDFPDVAAILVQMLIRHPAVGQFSDKLVATILNLKLTGIYPESSICFGESSICVDVISFSVDAFILCTSSIVADGLVQTGPEAFRRRYRIDVDSNCGKMFVTKLSLHLFNGDTSQAAFRILSDHRKGKFGWVALERPPT